MAKNKSPEQLFCEHLIEWDKHGIPYGITDLVKLANKYGAEVPDQFKHRTEPFMLTVCRRN